MKVGIITQETGFGTLRRWCAAWTAKDGVTRKVVTGPVFTEEDADDDGLMMFHKETFAKALGLAIIDNPPKDGG